jgi:hypothetical protein
MPLARATNVTVSRSPTQFGSAGGRFTVPQ